MFIIKQKKRQIKDEEIRVRRGGQEDAAGTTRVPLKVGFRPGPKVQCTCNSPETRPQI